MLLSVVFLLSVTGCLSAPPQPLCSEKELARLVDMSAARIERSRTYQYSLELLDTSIEVSRNASQVTLTGHFATLKLRNTALKKEYSYKGEQLLIKIPVDHMFSLSKPASL